MAISGNLTADLRTWLLSTFLILVNILKHAQTLVVICSVLVLLITSVLTNSAKGHIADLSPLVVANGFLRSWLPSNIWFLDPQESAAQNIILISLAVFAQHIRMASMQTDTHTHHSMCDICSNSPHLMHCMEAMA